jgi:hypothetical protein
VSVNFCGCCVQDTVVCGGGPDRGMAASDQHRGQLARREGLRSPGRPSCIISTVAGAHRGPGEAHDRALPVGPVTGLDRGEEPGQPGDAAGARRAVVMAKKSSSVRLFFRPRRRPIRNGAAGCAPVTHPIQAMRSDKGVAPPAADPGRRLPLVALVLQWRQDYPNKRPPTRATAIFEMGQLRPSQALSEG